MDDRKDEIRQANRKALPKFLLLVVISCIGGGVLGFCVALFGLDRMAGKLAAVGVVFCRQAAPWLLVVCAAAELAVCLRLYLRAKGLLKGWDGEDEDVYNQVDRVLSLLLEASSISMIVGFFLVAAFFAEGILKKMDTPDLFVLALGCFVLIMLETVLFQQRSVDLAKRIYPEKEGSVYDLKFQKKWMDSSDEAEKILVGKCAYKAYTAVNLTCMLLWMVFTLTAMFLDTGFLPVLAVCVIWGVSTIVYSYWGIKLSRPGTPVR